MPTFKPSSIDNMSRILLMVMSFRLLEGWREGLFTAFWLGLGFSLICLAFTLGYRATTKGALAAYTPRFHATAMQIFRVDRARASVARISPKHHLPYPSNSITSTHIPRIPSVQFTPKEVSYDKSTPSTIPAEIDFPTTKVDETREDPGLVADDNSSIQKDTCHNDPDVAMTSLKHDSLFPANSLPSPSTDIPTIVTVQFTHTEEVPPAILGSASAPQGISHEVLSDDLPETRQFQDAYDKPAVDETTEDRSCIADDGRSNQEDTYYDDPYVATMRSAEHYLLNPSIDIQIPRVRLPRPKGISHEVLSDDLPDAGQFQDAYDKPAVDKTTEDRSRIADDGRSNQEDTYDDDPYVTMRSAKHYLLNPSIDIQIPRVRLPRLKGTSHDVLVKDVPETKQSQDAYNVPTVDATQEDPCCIVDNEYSNQGDDCYDDPYVTKRSLEHYPPSSSTDIQIPRVRLPQLKGISHSVLSQDVQVTHEDPNYIASNGRLNQDYACRDDPYVTMHNLEHYPPSSSTDIQIPRVRLPQLKGISHSSYQKTSKYNGRLNQDYACRDDPYVTMRNLEHYPPSSRPNIRLPRVQLLRPKEISPDVLSEGALETEPVENVHDVPGVGKTHEGPSRIANDSHSSQDNTCDDDPYVTMRSQERYPSSSPPNIHIPRVQLPHPEEISPDILSEDPPDTERIEDAYDVPVIETHEDPSRVVDDGRSNPGITLLALRRDPCNIVLDSSTCPSVSPHIIITPPPPSPDDYYIPSQNRPDPQWTYFLTVPLLLQMWQDQRPPLPCDITSPLLVENEHTIEVESAPMKVFSASRSSRRVEAPSTEIRHTYKAAALEASTLARAACERFARKHKERVFSWSDPAEPILLESRWMHCTIIESDTPFTVPHIVISEPSPQNPWIDWMNRVNEQDDKYLTIYGSAPRALDDDDDDDEESDTWSPDPYGDYSGSEDSDFWYAERLCARVRSKLDQIDEEDEFPGPPDVAEPEGAKSFVRDEPATPSQRKYFLPAGEGDEGDLPPFDNWFATISTRLDAMAA
ncbi:hypothetical protein BU15DRAFT_74970 [Melanogaster broomeanus]|nr:hypothetical protein BU15DRAFT_74970 [Melanogaster broomeanus]